jgi:hypothetical protein
MLKYTDARMLTYADVCCRPRRRRARKPQLQQWGKKEDKEEVELLEAKP